MDDKHEFHLRRQAIRLWLHGAKSKAILKKVQRGRSWLSKWRKHFEKGGVQDLRSYSRRPHTAYQAYPPRIVQLIIRTRRRFVHKAVGLIGPHAIQRELRKVLGAAVPSFATIKRVLQTHHLIAKPVAQAYCPRPLLAVTGTLHALDWTCRYLEGGTKVYAFHTLNLRTRACTQTIATDKSTGTVIDHCLNTWKSLGIPRFFQLDNDAAFCGGYKAPRLFGKFVRLCLYLGIELIFLPVGEPERNGEIEEFNGLWGGPAFWTRHRFTSVHQVKRTSPLFVHWYMTDYAPPMLVGLTPKQAQRREGRHHLTAAQIAHLPDTLPITSGKLHFIRKVKPDGTVTLLNETWKVGKRLADHYVWATIVTHSRRLEIWYQPSGKQERRLRKTYVYVLPETVARLKPEFKAS